MSTSTLLPFHISAKVLDFVFQSSDFSFFGIDFATQGISLTTLSITEFSYFPLMSTGFFFYSIFAFSFHVFALCFKRPRYRFELSLEISSKRVYLETMSSD